MLGPHHAQLLITSKAHVHACMHTQTHTDINTHTHTCMHASTHKHTHNHEHMHTHVHTHSHLHTHAHTQTHTQSNFLNQSVLLQALLPVCMKFMASGESQVENIAQSKAKRHICHEILTKNYVFFIQMKWQCFQYFIVQYFTLYRNYFRNFWQKIFRW